MKRRARPGRLTFGDTKIPLASFSPLPARLCISGDYMKTRSAFALAKQSPLMWVAILLAAGGSLVFAIGGVMLWEQWSYRAHGRLAEGIVLSKDARTLRGRT